ncbi:hypothetical protein N825_34280 [Skermanella stibiiresistens SB22]|uniref:Oxidoreductase n=2 Tax=Skermanella TaxID=204447 RepID=W9GT04_9PROT|nr:hypothetical protein N825_34280 [Skermanella stibiiresistens SB22]
MAAILFLAALTFGDALAQTLPTPLGKPILSVSGSISLTNEGRDAVFDREMLEALGTVAFETATPWDKRPVRFEGVPLGRLLDLLGTSGTKLTAIALNDYSAELPIEDTRKYEVILALKRDGEYMPVRGKGPLFIVYNFDADPELNSQKFYSRSVWQVVRLEVR